VVAGLLLARDRIGGAREPYDGQLAERRGRCERTRKRELEAGVGEEPREETDEPIPFAARVGAPVPGQPARRAVVEDLDVAAIEAERVRMGRAGEPGEQRLELLEGDL